MTDVAAPSAAKSVYPWWAVLIQGIAAVVIGGLLMLQPAATTVVLVLFFGWWWLISGVFELGSLFVDRTAWGWRVFTGLLSIVAGGFIIGNTLLGAVAFLAAATLILGINGMLIGVVDIIKASQGAGWGKGLLGALSLVVGAYIAFNFEKFMIVLPWVWGLFAAAFGIGAIIMSFQIKKAQG
ncbi:MAG: DUF308 domain-containing protein [Coriobacteriia bacterium]